MKSAVALLLLLALQRGRWGALAVELPGSTLQLSEVYFSSGTVAAPNVELAGEVLQQVLSTDLPACSAACQDNAACSWFAFCSTQGGCMVDGRRLGNQQCLLQGSNCTLVPAVRQRNVTATSGFPIRTPGLEVPGYATRLAQGMQGGDLAECAGTVLPGACAFNSPLDAAAICAYITECRSVMVFSNGTDGCSDRPFALLKRSSLAPSNLFMAPSVYVLETTEDGSETAVYLGPGEARVVPAEPSAVPAAGAAGTAGTADTAADVATSTLWLGCILADNALMSGEVVRVVGDVATAEACCRACRAASPGCNVWNWCQPGATCSFKDRSIEATLQGGQCELRHQQLAEPDFGWPPAVVAKGSGIAFTAGAPLAVTGPPVEGFDVQLGSGLFGQPGVDCPDTIKPELQECVLSMPLAQLAEYCLQDSQCAAMVYKPAGLFLTQSGAAYVRHEGGANLSRLIYTPSSVLYSRSSRAPAGGGSGTASSSSLPVGAIAGIAVGAAVLAVVVGWAVLHLRRRRRRARRAKQEVLENQLQLTKSVGGNTGSSLADAAAGLLGYPASSTAAPTQGWGASTASPSTTGAMSTPFAAAVGLAPLDPLQLPSPDSTLALAAPSSMVATRAVSVPSHLTPPTPGHSHQSPVSPAQQAWKRQPPVASPFAAQGRRISEDAASRPSRPTRQTPHPPTVPDSVGAGQLAGVMAEVLQHRAAQEAAHLTGFTATSGSGGTVASHASGGSSRSQMVAASLLASLREWVIPGTDFEYLRRPTGELHLLGEGASGRVYKSVYNGEVIACKEVNLERSPQAQEAFVAEAARLQLLRHPLICGFFGVSISDDGRGIILMEYCAGHDLYSVLQLQAAGTGQRLFCWDRHGQRVATEVATAVNYLHLKKMVHMDIKSHNVLLDARGVAKLADMGVSRLQTRTYLSQLAPVGTFAWVAPEVLMGSQNCTQAVDIFSFGVLMWEIITGERPVRGQLRMPFVPEECPQEACDLMMQCLSLDATARPTAQQLMHRLSASELGPRITMRASV